MPGNAESRCRDVDLSQVRGAQPTLGRQSRNFRTYLNLHWIAIPVAVISIVALTVAATSGVRQTKEAAASRQSAAWNLDDNYWNCLERQARSLVQPGERVWIDPSFDLGKKVTLQFILAPWAVLVVNRNQARAWLNLRSTQGPGSCLGTVVYGRFQDVGGSHSVTRIGTGASLFSDQPLPSTPL